MPKTLPRFEDFEGEKELIEDLVFYGAFSIGSLLFFFVAEVQRSLYIL